MSLGDGASSRTATMRATAHPVRLQIMSLLAGAAMTAAEVARKLGLTHANASYHLRRIAEVGLIVPAGEERIRGGVAKRYRYAVGDDRDRILAAARDLHEAARPPGTPGTVRTSTAVAMFRMER
ncbi:ArsR/SmtB family transcription factor [Mangrovihabitans endophyticus]|uniref:HTH arsR-type domain-containing protein n=1 Tax=Mangrovihabitans endophyticus TaxID=1751298 RepID=A0A8J3FNR2_9ACTN|nr:winged helix-turn-helix domain-containing protein [Mangrovihabitans endophyticus]GGK95325.1 hypothetical protein GCM10012284_31760 [Mangrovihabitans endophyticus]